MQRKSVRKHLKWNGMATLKSRMRQLVLITPCLYFYCSNSCRFSYENLMVLFILRILNLYRSVLNVQ